MANEKFSASFPSFIESTQSADFAAMSAGLATLQFTVVGASPGDAVLVTATENAIILDTYSLRGYCDTADLVDVVITDNDNAGTDDLAAVNISILVFK